MALLPIKIAPGFFKNATQYQAKNRWYDGNLVRFSEGRVRPIGGWQRLTDTQITQKRGVAKLTITDPGSGYVGSGELSAVGSAVQFEGTYTVSGGKISTVKITDPGTGYTSIPTIVLTPDTGTAGSGAVITAELYTGVDPIRGLHSWRLSTGARYLAIGSVQSLRIWDGSQSAGVNAPIYDITPPTSPGSALPFHQQADFEIAGLGFGALQYGGDTGVTYKLSGSGGFAHTAYTGSKAGGDIYGTPRYSADDPNVQDADAFRDNFASVVSFDNFGDDLLACHSGEGTIWYWSIHTGGSVEKTFTTASGITELLPVGPTPASIQPYTYIPDGTNKTFTTSSGITALTATGESGNPANTYLPDDLSQTFTTSSGAEVLVPVGPTPASIQPKTTGQWECNDPHNSNGAIEITHTNVEQTLTSGSGNGAKFTVVTQLGLAMAARIYYSNTTVTNLAASGGTSDLRVGMLVHGLSSFGHSVTPTIADIPNNDTIFLSAANGYGAGTYATNWVSFIDPATRTGGAGFWAGNHNISSSWVGDHGLAVDDEIYFTGNFHGITGFTANTTYYVHSIINDYTYRVSATQGGNSIQAGGSGIADCTFHQDTESPHLKSVTPTTAGGGYAEGDTIVLTDPGNTSHTATITVGPTGTGLTSTAHTLENGHKVQLSTTSALPGGLSTNTDFYIRDKTANTFQLATSLNGTAIPITSGGTGTHTWTNSGANLAYWQSGLPTHTNVSQTSTSGSGSGARFTIAVPSETYLSAVVVATAGVNYAVGDTIVVTDPGNTANVATLTVGTLDGTITSTGHGLVDTNKVQLSTSGALPGGLDAATDLYVRDKTADTFKLATISNGTAVALTTVGSGTHTWTISGANKAPWQNQGTLTNQTQTSTSGGGSGAKFTVVTSAENNLGSVTVTTVGSGYAVNDTILLTDPGNTVNVATITVKAINSEITHSGAGVHGLSDGDIVKVWTLGTLPGDLPSYTDLYVRDSQTDTFKLALSSTGDAIAFLDQGYGEHTWKSLTGSAISFNNATQTATAPVTLQSLNGSTGVPVGSNVAVLVTPERHILILAPDGAHRTIQWGSQDSLTDFSPTLLNTAGDLDLQTKGRIIGGFKTRYGVLIFTTSDVWRTNYLGPPYVYGVERLTEGAGPVGMKSIAGSADFVAWMSRGRFWSYTGGYIKELSCEVADYVFTDINLDVEGLIAAGHNGEFGEISWFYPKEGDSVCTRYVTYSYREEHWTTGELQRVAMEPSDALGYPVWAGSDGYLYRHEMDPDTHNVIVPRDSSVTVPADIDALSGKANRVVAKGVSTSTHSNVATENHLCYVESGAIEIGGGNKMMSVNSILTDTDAGTNGLRMKVVTGKTPDAPGDIHGPFTLEGDGYTDCRFTDRQAILRVESPFDQEWRFGEVRFEAAASGKR